MDGFLLLFGLDLDLDLDLDLSIASVANLWSGFLASVEFGCESMDLTDVPVEGGRKSLDRDVLVVAASIFPMETDWGSKCGNPSTTGGSSYFGYPDDTYFSTTVVISFLYHFSSRLFLIIAVR